MGFAPARNTRPGAPARAACRAAPGAASAPWVHPRFRRMEPPVVVVGMHRSGTSLIAGMLGFAGLYIGPEFERFRAGFVPDDAARLNGYGETAEFFRLNERLLRRARAAWSRVEPFLVRRGDPGFAAAGLLSLAAATFGPLRRGFLGALPQEFRGPWGWKDPRNSLTFPFWRRLFPGARVLHVRRNPEAAAESLHRRALAWAASAAPSGSGRSAAARVRHAGRRLGLLRPLPPDACLDRGYCRLLCDRYTAACLEYRSAGVPYMEIWYEDALADPLAVVRALGEFAGCAPSRAREEQAAALVRPASVR